MAGRQTVTVVGAAEVRKALRKAGDDMSELKDANAKVAKMAARAVAAKAPRRTGKLAASIKGNRAQRKATIRSNLVYAPVINYGWAAHGIEPSHYAERGIDQSRPQWAGEYERELKQLARKAERVTT